MASGDRTTFGNIDPKCAKHSALSSTILDYYHRYGRNRDLEKYLRFRNRSSSGSSSVQLSPTSESRVGKSLENLNILESCLEPEKTIQKSKSSESLNRSGRSKSEGTSDKREKSPIADNQIKFTAKKAVKSKKKYNINMDTSIEITLPQQAPQSYNLQQQPQQQMLTHFEPLTQHDFSQQKIEFGTSETQTDRTEFPKTPNRSEFDMSDIPARPSSVASSVSNKQRLEWDSMADVGYYKSVETNNLTNLTEFERKALKKFFRSHGLNFDDEIVVFASKSKLSNSVPELRKQDERARIREKWESAFQKILEEKYAKRNGRGKDVKVDRKRLWQSALAKFREKYGTHFNPESDLCITEPAVHSTPILMDSSTGAIPKVRRNFSDTISQTEDVAEKERIVQHTERACQTSMITTSSKECQVDDTASDGLSGVSVLDQGVSSTDNSRESGKSGDCKEGLISATSFEFFAPDAFDRQDKENIPPRKKEIAFQSKPTEAPIDDNKENVPPRVPSEEEIIEKFVFTTPKKSATESSQNDSSVIDEIFGVVSSLENDLALGVEVLCSLAKGKDLSDEKRKKLVRKVIKRITTAKYKDSTASSESIVSSTASRASASVIGNPQSKPNISGVNTLSSTSSSSTNKELSVSSSAKAKRDSAANSNENSLKDWLKPMTKSEMLHEKSKSKDWKANENLQETKSERMRLSRNSYNSEESQCDPNVLKFVEKQRQSQFEWIDKEICHLVHLKEILKKKRETDIMKDIVNLEMNRKPTDTSNDTDKSKESGVIYENIYVDPGSRNFAESKPDGSTGRASLGTASQSHSKGSEVPSNRSKENHPRSNEKDAVSDASSSADWNSHLNMQQFVHNRKKLQTPNDDVIVTGKYDIRSRPIYTQPYSSDHSDHYSEPHDNDRKTSSKKTTNHAYTSITGSDGFLSSDSVSIPVANSTSNTTTHQYDTRASVAIQTTNSLTRTEPIFRVKSDSCNCGAANCNCVNRRPTIRVKYQTNDKQLQVVPKAISYDINFDGKKSKTEAKLTGESVDNRMKSENYMRHSDSSSASSSSSKESKTKSERNFVGNFGGCAKLSLQEHLKSARPEFVSQADQRRKCVIELHKLRDRRNEQRNRLFLLSSNQSLRNHIKALNPPSNVGKRIFTTKALKQQTRKRYNKLPEIVSKEENERQNRIKRSNRIVRDMFNKNLQTRVLKGQTDLSNSVFVAAI